MLVLGGDKCRQYLGRLDATRIALVSFDLKPTPLAEICHGSWGWLPTELEVEEAVKRVDEGERSKKGVINLRPTVAKKQSLVRGRHTL